MSNHRATIKDVAATAGVSPTTVSFVLNGKGRISDEIRKRVYRAVNSLGYRKNLFAAAMVKKTSFNIAVLIVQDYEKAYEWNFIRNMFIKLQSVINIEGYYPILVPVSLKMKSADILEEILSSGVRALFSIHYGNAALFKLVEDFGVPVVMINNADYQDNFFTVCSDDFQGAYEGALQLIRRGHRKISFVDYDRPDFKTCQSDRFIGFKKALDENNITLPRPYKLSVELSNGNDIQENIRALFRSSSSPTAIFAHDDYLAAKITVVLQKLGRKFPDDVSIVAPGDVLDYNEPFIPRISTMQIDTKLIGRLAGELMMSRLKDNIKENQAIKIKQTFVDRGSIKSYVAKLAIGR